MTLLVDTNVWVAAHDERDPDHQRCADVLRDHNRELAAPVTVVAETAWFIEDRHGPSAEAKFLRLITSRALDVIDLTAADWERCIELIETYSQLGLGAVDASIVAIAERLGFDTIATMNSRDFKVVRPAHIDAFTPHPVTALHSHDEPVRSTPVNAPASAPTTVLCDLDGVVWLSGEPIAGSVEAVARLRGAGHRVLFVTNSSWPRLSEHEAALEAIGIDARGDVVSSPMAAATLVKAGERVLVAGGPGIAEAVESAGAAVVAGDDDSAVSNGVDAVVVGLHQEFDYHRLTLATTAVRSGARFVATNNDPLYPTPSGPVPGGGSIVAAVATASGRDPVIAGKPFKPMADAVRRLLGPDADIVMVGDMLSTDGRFAVELGCRFALVRTGNTAPGEPVDFPRAFDEPDLAAVADLIVTAPT